MKSVLHVLHMQLSTKWLVRHICGLPETTLSAVNLEYILRFQPKNSAYKVHAKKGTVKILEEKRIKSLGLALILVMLHLTYLHHERNNVRCREFGLLLSVQLKHITLEEERSLNIGRKISSELVAHAKVLVMAS